MHGDADDYDPDDLESYDDEREEVDADHQLVEQLRSGQAAPAGDNTAALVEQWRQEVHTAPLPPISGWFEDPTAPSGWSWTPDLSRLPHLAAPTGVMPAVRRDPPRPHPAEAGQDDLTRFDRGVVNTAKSGPGDELLAQPPQDPDWRPQGNTL